MVDFAEKVWKDAPPGYRLGDPVPPDATPIEAASLNDLEGRVGGAVSALDADAAARVDAAVTALVASAPAALNTLKELADALGDDANFAATVSASLAAKLDATRVGLANGVAPLDASQHVPQANLPVPVYIQQAQPAAPGRTSLWIPLEDDPDNPGQRRAVTPDLWQVFLP